MFYYSFNVGDYVGATAHLSNEEDLAYRRLLDLYYTDEAQIPPDLAKVARKIRCDIGIVRTVLDEFFEQTQDGWRHDRCERELAKYHGRKAQAASAGKASGQKRRQSANERTFNERSTDVQRTFNGCSTDVELTNNQEPITKNQEPNTPPNPPKGNRVRSKPEPEKLGAPLFGGPALQAAWLDFVEHRKQMKKPLTNLSAKKIAEVLYRSYNEGYCPVAMLNKSVANGWQGVFPAKPGDALRSDAERRFVC
jgi:uncharacterized protein YdaU (DUF1376 family)